MTRIYCEGFWGKIFGHKYIVVYNETEHNEFPQHITKANGDAGYMLALKTYDSTKTYVKSICKRCGDEIK